MPHRCPGSLPSPELNVDRCLITLSLYGYRNTNFSLKRKSKTFRSLKKLHFFSFQQEKYTIKKIRDPGKG